MTKFLIESVQYCRDLQTAKIKQNNFEAHKDKETGKNNLDLQEFAKIHSSMLIPIPQIFLYTVFEKSYLKKQ